MSQQTSSTLASTIITYARYYLNESTASFWADAELLVWLNQGTMDIVNRTRCLEGTEDINLANNTLEYSITSNYIDVTAVMYTDSDGKKRALNRQDPRKVGYAGDDVNPQHWYEWAGKVGVFPILETRTTETITVYYVSRPATVASNENVLVPAIYDKALTLYITGEAWKKAGQFGKAQAFKNDYKTELDRFRKDFVVRPPDSEEDIS